MNAGCRVRSRRGQGEKGTTMRKLAFWTALAVVASAIPAVTRADEMDDLVRKLGIRARWHGYTPNFHHTQQTFTFEEPGGPKKRTWRLIKDGPRFVALLPDDHIQMLGFTVGTAPTALNMPGRYLLDTCYGPTLGTQTLIPRTVVYQPDGSNNISRSDSFAVGGSKITLIRVSPRSRVLVIKKYAITVDEHLGYMVTGDIEVTFRKPDPSAREYTTDLECGGSFQPWPGENVYDTTVLTPGDANDVQAYANNTAAMAKIAAAGPIPLRDGGFVAWLNRENSWSPCRSFSGIGSDANMTLDPASNTLHLRIPIPPEINNDPNGIRRTWRFQERLFTLPPELVAHLRKSAKPVLPSGGGLVLRVGQPESFEDQPLAFSKPVRGLAWRDPNAAPKLMTTRAASGTQCLPIDGKAEVNVPWVAVTPDIQRVCLKPNSKYVIEAMMKARDLSTEDRRGYRQAYDVMADKMLDANQTPPDFVPLYPHAEAYIIAELYGSADLSLSPARREKTTVAKADNPAWQKVTLELTTPEYYTYLKLSFVCHSGTAMLDNFSITEAK